ncbi:MAG: class I SAM-dependent methyltransferase [Acidobacteria bacterium]|nr:class I SAM-dependent methyltransferase [Acidobacteriota bacterium]
MRRRFPAVDDRLEEWFRTLGFGALPSPPAYFEDGLCSLHDHGFVADERFEKAYLRGIQASGGVDHRIRWRAHIFLWAARQAAALPGDFVECGVNTGFLSSAMLADLEWGRLDKTLYLLDTFAGPVRTQYSEEELREGRWDLAREAVEKGAYQTNLEAVRANFSEWPRVELIPGMVPETLRGVPAERIAFLHLDMNCAAPEIAALEYFWPRLVPGGFVVSDDFAARGFDSLRRGYAEVLRELGGEMAALPTGQGLLIKPAPAAEVSGAVRQ